MLRARRRRPLSLAGSRWAWERGAQGGRLAPLDLGAVAALAAVVRRPRRRRTCCRRARRGRRRVGAGRGRDGGGIGGRASWLAERLDHLALVRRVAGPGGGVRRARRCDVAALSRGPRRAAWRCGCSGEPAATAWCSGRSSTSRVADVVAAWRDRLPRPSARPPPTERLDLTRPEVTATSCRRCPGSGTATGSARSALGSRRSSAVGSIGARQEDGLGGLRRSAGRLLRHAERLVALRGPVEQPAWLGRPSVRNRLASSGPFGRR